MCVCVRMHVGVCVCVCYAILYSCKHNTRASQRAPVEERMRKQIHPRGKTLDTLTSVSAGGGAHTSGLPSVPLTRGAPVKCPRSEGAETPLMSASAVALGCTLDTALSHFFFFFLILSFYLSLSISTDRFCRVSVFLFVYSCLSRSLAIFLSVSLSSYLSVSLSTSLFYLSV